MLTLARVSPCSDAVSILFFLGLFIFFLVVDRVSCLIAHVWRTGVVHFSFASSLLVCS